MSHCKKCGASVPYARAGVTVNWYGCVVCFSEACTKWAERYAPKLVIVEGLKQGATAYTQSGARMALKCNNKKSNLWRD